MPISTKNGRFRLLMAAMVLLTSWAMSGCDDDSPATTDAGDSGATDAAEDRSDAGDLVEEDLGPPGVLRFIHISDLHLRGEVDDPRSGPLEEAIEILNALEFDADLVVATGDFVDFIPPGVTPEDPSLFRLAVELLNDLRWPVITTVGNHDYYKNEQLAFTDDRAARDEYLRAVLGHPLDYTVIENGIRLIAMNSMAGDRWQANAGLVGSYTDAQLEWMRDELADGRPTILLVHHPPTPGVFTPGGDSLCQVFEDHADAVKAVFAGHLHGFWRDEFCGVPYYLVANLDPQEPFYFLVEYDGPNDVLTVVNEDEIPFPELPEYTCDPDTQTLAHPEDAVGTHQAIDLRAIVTNLPGFEGVDGEALDAIRFFVHIDDWDAETSTYSARLTVSAVDDGFADYMENAPCIDLRLNMDGGCLVSDSISMPVDAIPIIQTMLSDFEAKPGWQIRLDIETFWFEGTMVDGADGGPPFMETGLIQINGSGTGALNDVRSILVQEYCAGAIPTCEPGSADDTPLCPAEPDASFWEEIPEACDVDLAGFPLRFLLMFVESYPLENITLTGEIGMSVYETSDEPLEDFASPDLFSTEPGMNCE